MENGPEVMENGSEVNAKLPAWVHVFSGLQEVNDPIWLGVANRAKEVVLPAGKYVFNEGEPCKKYIFVVDGATRVYKGFESGREILLYRLQGGETCSLTTSMLLAGGLYPATAVTEKETRAILISAADFDLAFNSSKGFRDFVCHVFGGHIRELIMLLESVTARHVDNRLAKLLLENDGSAKAITLSHRELAFELGTAREVVSRHLKEFENRGWIRLSRKCIELTDIPALEKFTQGCGA